MRLILCALLMTLGGYASAHQLTPTYPSLKPFYAVPGILTTEMVLFNARSDVEYYEFNVFDREWNAIPFATESKIVRLKHLQRKKVNIHIREKDKTRAMYICSESKLIGSGTSLTMVSSKICSKIK